MVVMAVLPPSLRCRELFTGRETLRLLCRPTITDSRAAATASAVALAAAAFDWFALAAALGAAAHPRTPGWPPCGHMASAMLTVSG